MAPKTLPQTHPYRRTLSTVQGSLTLKTKKKHAKEREDALVCLKFPQASL